MTKKIDRCSENRTCCNPATHMIYEIMFFPIFLQCFIKPVGYRIKTVRNQMKKNLLLVLVLFSSVLCMASGDKNGKHPPIKRIQPDSTVCAMLGQSISDVLFNPRKVTCYTIKGKGEIEPADFQVEPHWVRDSLVGTLSPQMIGVLQFALVANSENFKNDTLFIKAPYFPILEFEFRKKMEIVHVLISISDHTWTIVYDGERQIHFNYHDFELIERFCNLFVKFDE